MVETVVNPEIAKINSRASECMRRLLEAGLTFDDLQKPINDPALCQLLVQYWKGGAPITSYSVTVDYDRQLECMIADGKYDCRNPDINARNFPIEGKRAADVDIELIPFDRAVTSEEAYAELDKLGLRPATLPELLAFGAKYSAKQCKVPIVALGSVWPNSSGHRSVACLRDVGSERTLCLNWLEDGWRVYYRFAAVRK